MEFTLIIYQGMIKMKYQQGLTLVEISASLAIVSVLAFLAAPSMGDLYNKSQSTTTINNLFYGVKLLRQKAIIDEVTMTMCPSTDHQECLDDWNAPLIVFTDHNRNHTVDEQDRVLTELSPVSKGGSLKLNASARRKYLQINPRGLTPSVFGNIVYCPNDNNPAYAQQIVISRTGRARLSKRRNDAGIIIGSNNRPLECT